MRKESKYNFTDRNIRTVEMCQYKMLVNFEQPCIDGMKSPRLSQTSGLFGFKFTVPILSLFIVLNKIVEGQCYQ